MKTIMEHSPYPTYPTYVFGVGRGNSLNQKDVSNLSNLSNDSGKPYIQNIKAIHDQQTKYFPYIIQKKLDRLDRLVIAQKINKLDDFLGWLWVGYFS